MVMIMTVAMTIITWWWIGMPVSTATTIFGGRRWRLAGIGGRWLVDHARFAFGRHSMDDGLSSWFVWVAVFAGCCCATTIRS